MKQNENPECEPIKIMTKSEMVFFLDIKIRD